MSDSDTETEDTDYDKSDRFRRVVDQTGYYEIIDTRSGNTVDSGELLESPDATEGE